MMRLRPLREMARQAARTRGIMAGTAAVLLGAGCQSELTYLDPDSAGIDHRIQGEYAGTLAGKDGTEHAFGAQVIALGNGVFDSFLLPGGLPGSGWDGGPRIGLEGRFNAGQVQFLGVEGWRMQWGRDALTGTHREESALRLRKVERKSPTLGAAPPAGADVLFDGSGMKAWEEGVQSVNGHLMAGATTKEHFDDFTLHLEFLLPFQPGSRGQQRANSGVYLQDRYEIQLLDSFGQPPETDGCGAIYDHRAPSLNASYPPLAWQTYDIEFRAARFDERSRKLSDATVTVRHNGVLIHDAVEIRDRTGGGRREGASPGPIRLQDHGDPVLFRNVWIVRGG